MNLNSETDAERISGQLLKSFCKTVGILSRNKTTQVIYPRGASPGAQLFTGNFFSNLILANSVLMHGQGSMKTVKLLLASFDRRTNNLVEMVVRDACFGRAIVECVRTARIDELYFFATRDEYDFIVVAPNHLMPEPSRKTEQVTLEESLRTIHRIKLQTAAPVIAVSVARESELATIQAGAEAALGLCFTREALEFEVQRVLNLPPQAEPQPEVSVPASGSFLRALHRLLSPRTP